MSAILESGSANRQREVFQRLYKHNLWSLMNLHDATRSMKTDDMLMAGSVYANGCGNDIDVVLVTTHLAEYATRLDEAGWSMCSAEVYRGVTSDGWFSAKLGEYNLLVSEPDVAERWIQSSEACRMLREVMERPTTRDERVQMHQIIWGEV